MRISVQLLKVIIACALGGSAAWGSFRFYESRLPAVVRGSEGIATTEPRTAPQSTQDVTPDNDVPVSHVSATPEVEEDRPPPIRIEGKRISNGRTKPNFVRCREFSVPFANEISHQTAESGTEISIAVCRNYKVIDHAWSPDGKFLAVLLHEGMWLVRLSDLIVVREWSVTSYTDVTWTSEGLAVSKLENRILHIRLVGPFEPTLKRDYVFHGLPELPQIVGDSTASWLFLYFASSSTIRILDVGESDSASDFDLAEIPSTWKGTAVEALKDEPWRIASIAIVPDNSLLIDIAFYGSKRNFLQRLEIGDGESLIAKEIVECEHSRNAGFDFGLLRDFVTLPNRMKRWGMSRELIAQQYGESFFGSTADDNSEKFASQPMRFSRESGSIDILAADGDTPLASLDQPQNYRYSDIYVNPHNRHVWCAVGLNTMHLIHLSGKWKSIETAGERD